MHAKYNSLSEATRSLSQGPRQTFTLSTTEADPYLTLCLVDAQCERDHMGTLYHALRKSQPPFVRGNPPRCVGQLPPG